MKTATISQVTTKICIIVGMTSLFASCVNLKKVELMQPKSITDYSQEITNPGQSEYRLNSGDHLYVKIFSSDANTSKMFQTDFPELMNSSYIYLNSYKIDEDGYVNYSFAGKILVKGMTIPEAQEAIKETLEEYYKDINVYVKLVDFDVTVLGEVKSPGTYKIDKEQFTLLQALGLAGGITDFGRAEKITLVRKSTNGNIVRQFDITDNGILASEYLYLLPDDVIYVAPRGAKSFAFEKFPYGIVLSIISFGFAIYAVTK